MTVTIKKEFISAILSSYVSSIGSDPSEWTPNTLFSVSKKCRVVDRIYICGTGGISGLIPPVHTSGKALDGEIEWLFVEYTEASDSLSGAIYLGLGGPNSWANEITGDNTDNWPETKTISAVKTFLKLNSQDVSLGIERKEWATGTIIPMWPDESSYRLVGNSVYRCLDNNAGAASTVSPSGSGILLFETTDGYIWKYLGDVSPNLDQKFGQVDVFPIAELTKNDGGGRWLVQQSALANSITGFEIVQQQGTFTTPTTVNYGAGTGLTTRVDLNVSGTIKRMAVLSPGIGYSDEFRTVINNSSPGIGANVQPTVSGGLITAVTVSSAGTGYTNGAFAIVDGDGTGAACSLTVTSGFITGATITPGSGYSWAKVYVIPGSVGALAKPIMAPPGGIGKNMTKELPLNFLLVSRRITSLDSGYIPITPIRQVTLCTGIPGGKPRLLGPATTPVIGKDSANVNGAKVLFVSNSAPFSHTQAQDELLKIALEVK